MSEAETQDPPKETDATDKAADAASGGGAEGEVAFAEPEVAKAEPDPLEVAKAEAQKYREQLLRTAADFDNFRKRSRREIEDAQKKGKEQTVKELLSVFDNLERALMVADSAPDAKSVVDGLKMIMRQFGTTLEKLNIKRVQAVGQPFDPMRHEAIQHAHSDEHAAGVVMTEVQPGYLLGETLMRAAMVVVSKGPADAAPSEDKPAEAGADAPASGDGEPVN
jgi:molecular chaperone GrpE